MSIRKKLALIGIFSLVIITMVIAIVRVAVISALTRQPDTSWSYMWSSIEQCIGESTSFRGSTFHRLTKPACSDHCLLLGIFSSFVLASRFSQARASAKLDPCFKERLSPRYEKGTS